MKKSLEDLVAARLRSGLSPDEAAALMNVSPEKIEDWESGRLLMLGSVRARYLKRLREGASERKPKSPISPQADAHIRKIVAEEVKKAIQDALIDVLPKEIRQIVTDELFKKRVGEPRNLEDRQRHSPARTLHRMGLDGSRGEILHEIESCILEEVRTSKKEADDLRSRCRQRLS